MRTLPPRSSGGDLTASFGPVLFGSQREMLAGILRARPDPDSAAPARAIQIARRLPKAARGGKPHLVALCEVGEMLADRLGLPGSVHGLFVTLTERWDGKGQLRRAKREEIPLAMRIANVARDAAVQHLVDGVERAASVVRARGEARSTRGSPIASRTTRPRSWRAIARYRLGRRRSPLNHTRG
jgi:HD domain